MLQHDHLFPWCSVWDNVLLGLKIKRACTPQKTEERLQELLERYGLADFIHSNRSRLSRRHASARSADTHLALEPELLLDEPFSALDYQTRINVSDDIAGIIRKQGKTALVTHDI